MDFGRDFGRPFRLPCDRNTSLQMLSYTRKNTLLWFYATKNLYLIKRSLKSSWMKQEWKKKNKSRIKRTINIISSDLLLCVLPFLILKFIFKKKKLMVLTTKAADCIQIKHLTENKNKLYFLLFHRWFDTFSCFYWRLFFFIHVSHSKGPWMVFYLLFYLSPIFFV